MSGRRWLTACLALLLLAGPAHRAWSGPEDEPSADEESFEPAPRPTPAPAAGKAQKRGYQRSRLTSDESEATADRRKLLLASGEDRAVDLDFEVNAGAKGIAIGNPQVVLSTLVKMGDKRQLVFKPLKAGETTVTVRDTDGTLRLVFQVSVTGSNLLRKAGEMRELLRDIEGIDIKIVGQKIVIDGEVLVPGDYGRLLQVAQDKSYSDSVLTLASISPLAIQALAQRIKGDINVFAPKVEVRLVNGMIFLEGMVDSPDKAKRAFELAKLYLPDAKPGNPIASRDPSAQVLPPRSLIQNFILVEAAPPRKQEKLVRVTVHFVELAKDFNKAFGFKWEPGFTSNPQITIGDNGTGTGATGPSFSATISSLFPKLRSAQDAGYARVLKTGTVVVRSGQPASLNEQTEFPFTRMGPNGQPVGDSKPVGLEVSVTPKIVGQSEDIDMDLELNQVSLVARGAAGAAPITTNHKVKTKLYVKSSESAAVAGVTSADVKTDFNKDDPNQGSFQGQTDPLFTLKHTKSYAKQKSQFVIFVTPQVIENASEGTDDLKKNFRVKVR